jgi:hypothetical protein
MAWLNSAECGSSGLKMSVSSSLSYTGAFCDKDSCDTYNEIDRRSRVVNHLIIVIQICHLIEKTFILQPVTNSASYDHSSTRQVLCHQLLMAEYIHFDQENFQR